MNNSNSLPGISRLMLLLGVVIALATAYGCGKKGNGETAGEKVDEAVDEAKNGPDDLFDKDGKAENAGEEIDEALDNDK
jgi:hypothetical protein